MLDNVTEVLEDYPTVDVKLFVIFLDRSITVRDSSNHTFLVDEICSISYLKSQGSRHKFRTKE